MMTRTTSMAAKLKDHGFFIGADSAYPLLSFMKVSYINLISKQQDPVGAKDAFNYYLSSEMIWIDRAFGEYLILRDGEPTTASTLGYVVSLPFFFVVLDLP
jgi:hypothetical protein